MDYPLTPLEQLPLTIDHEAIESAYLPFLLDGRDGERAWKSDYARRRRRALLRMVKRILGLKSRDKQAIQSEYHKAWSAGHGKYDIAAGPAKPAAWRWRGRKLALDGLAAARLRAPLLAAVIDRLEPRKVLEVGCGNGINLFSLAGDFPDVEFTGIDLTPAGIEAAKAVQAEDKLPPALAEYIPLPNPDPTAFKRIRFMQGSAAELPFADNEFDLVYTVLAVEQMERIRDTGAGRNRPRQSRPRADARAVQGHQPQGCPPPLRDQPQLFPRVDQGVGAFWPGAVVGDR